MNARPNATKPAPARSHRLEANFTGRYSPVISFDAMNATARNLVRKACEGLATVDPRVAFRVCDQEGTTLLNYSAQFGWTEGTPS